MQDYKDKDPSQPQDEQHTPDPAEPEDLAANTARRKRPRAPASALTAVRRGGDRHHRWWRYLNDTRQRAPDKRRCRNQRTARQDTREREGAGVPRCTGGPCGISVISSARQREHSRWRHCFTSSPRESNRESQSDDSLRISSSPRLKDNHL